MPQSELRARDGDLAGECLCPQSVELRGEGFIDAVYQPRRTADIRRNRDLPLVGTAIDRGFPRCATISIFHTDCRGMACSQQLF